ncbi:MAG TPA: hypothetical protein VIE65_20680 [Methylobacter sp.]
MALDTYANLQLAIADRIHRADLTAVIPDFIRQAEDVIYADLDARKQDIKSTLTAAANIETIALPSDFMNFRSVTVASSNPMGTLDYRAPDQYAQEFQFGNTGTPRVYTIIGDNLYVQPIPDQDYTLDIVYEGKLLSLSNTNQTNWLLTSYPAVYLYAALVQAAIYMMKDPSTYQAVYDKTIQGVRRQDWASGNTMQVKTDINLTSFLT